MSREKTITDTWKIIGGYIRLNRSSGFIPSVTINSEKYSLNLEGVREWRDTLNEVIAEMELSNE